jgi:serine/threonine protein kinase
LEGISSEKSYEKQLPEPEVDIEKIEMKENEFVDTKYIPKYIVCWINVKGYELEIEGAKSILGISSHSIVRRGKRISDSKPIAAKVILAGMDELSKRNNKPPQELFFAKKVDHQSIVKVLDIFCVMAQRVQNHDTMFSFIIMELANNSLDKVIKREGKLIEDNAKQVFQQIASAVLYLHTNYIAHCNIRLDNCLVFDNNVIKLCDFSRAENIFLRLDGQLSNKFSSLKYMPPEFYESENFELLKIDIWMSACLLYSLLSANLSPFGDLKKDDLIAKTETFQSFRNRQNDGLPQDIVVSDKGKDLLIQMFKTNPNERINARQVFSNDWLK